MTQIYAPGTPNWVDLGSTDVPGATGFYGSLFGWTVDDLGPEAGGYGIFRKNGRQVAGVGPATDPSRGTSWATYFATDDADDVASKVQANGGQVVMAPMDVMDQGRMAVCTDPTGVFFAVWQAGKHLGAELVNEPGSLTWNELTTTDMAAAKAFYPAVLGVTIRDVSMGEGMTYTLFEVDDRAVAGGMQVDPAGMPTPESFHTKASAWHLRRSDWRSQSGSTRQRRPPPLEACRNEFFSGPLSLFSETVCTNSLRRPKLAKLSEAPLIIT